MARDLAPSKVAVLISWHFHPRSGGGRQAFVTENQAKKNFKVGADQPELAPPSLLLLLRLSGARDRPGLRPPLPVPGRLLPPGGRRLPPGPARSRVQPSRQRPRRRAGLLVRSEKRLLKPSEARSAILRLMAAAVVLPVVPSAAARGSEARPSLSGERPTVSAGARQQKGAQRNSSR